MANIELRNINKTYGKRKIINNFSLNIYNNEMIAIVGKSGSGKTTLLNIIGLLDYDYDGEILINEEIVTSNEKITQNYHRSDIGFLFQNFALIENWTIKENLDVAKKYAEKVYTDENYKQILDKVGLGYCDLNQKVYELSGGEQQRVAIARLLVKPCTIVLADEPTGSLDSNNQDVIVSLLTELKNDGKTIIIVTHDLELANYCDRKIELS